MNALQRLLVDPTPAIDIRAPIEFAKGSIPNAVNLPILEDDERARVGTTYKQSGPEAARKLGFELVSDATRETRVDAWRAHLARHPGALLFCWRGGDRSAIATGWLSAAGTPCERVEGGYKALRQTCLAALERAANQPDEWWVLAGRTGSGKTDVIRALPNAIDLEGLAAHRGSAFGAHDVPQPSLAGFENALAAEFLRRRDQRVVLEDESRTIGRIAVPEAVHAAMQQVPLALLEVSFEARVANIEREYVTERLPHHSAAELERLYQGALDRIQRRLGGQRHREVSDALRRGFAGGDHAGWIARLLEWYYDPMYDYQLSRKEERIKLRGDAATITAALRSEAQPG